MNPNTSVTTGAKLRPQDLFSLEQYAKQRSEFRPKVIAHKRNRTLQCGPNATWLFEDRLTVQYQVQEMLRIERIFESEGIADELAAYNPLIPDGSNWKATLLIEFPAIEERRVALTGLKGVEDRCWVRVAGHDRVFAIADEDLERENDEKTSSVHFLRFEFEPAAIAAVKQGVAIAIGVDHPNCTLRLDEVAPQVQAALARDFR